MSIEISSGGVVYRKKGVNIEILLLKDKNGEWTFPKGLVEEGEDRVETAKREIAEEVGLENVQYISEINTIHYFYRRGNELIRKTVYYYLFQFVGGETPRSQKDEGIEEVQWYASNEALKVIGYKKTNENILEQAIEKIK